MKNRATAIISEAGSKVAAAELLAQKMSSHTSHWIVGYFPTSRERSEYRKMRALMNELVRSMNERGSIA